MQCLIAIKPAMSAGEANALFERLLQARSEADAHGMLLYSLGRRKGMEKFSSLSWG